VESRPVSPQVAARTIGDMSGAGHARHKQQRESSFLSSTLIGVGQSSVRQQASSTGDDVLYGVLDTRCRLVPARYQAAGAACPVGVEEADWRQAFDDLACVTEQDWVEALQRELPRTPVGRVTGNLWIEGLIAAGTTPAGITQEEWIDALDHLWHTERTTWKNALLYLRNLLVLDADASPLVRYIREVIGPPDHVVVKDRTRGLINHRRRAPAIGASGWNRIPTLTERFEQLDRYGDFHSHGFRRSTGLPSTPVLKMIALKALTCLPPPIRKSRFVRAMTPTIPFPTPVMSLGNMFRATAELGTLALSMQSAIHLVGTPRCHPLSMAVSATEEDYGETTLEVVGDAGPEIVRGGERIDMLTTMPLNLENDFRARAIAFLDGQRTG
jgi:hypothetical protein